MSPSDPPFLVLHFWVAFFVLACMGVGARARLLNSRGRTLCYLAFGCSTVVMWLGAASLVAFGGRWKRLRVLEATGLGFIGRGEGGEDHEIYFLLCPYVWGCRRPPDLENGGFLFGGWQFCRYLVEGYISYIADVVFEV
ncbi:hypothetical protein B0O99DRAFT_626786 [Bisporella sp. PMI_857]|nr:hypothetical protein B0O99DRAFT_626786 [Bisporella sp. PMI_857]